MGLEVVFGLASLAIGVISGINQMNAANETKDAANRAANYQRQAAEAAQSQAAADKEANAIASAQQSVVALEDRRQRVREERVRRAAMTNAAENSGTSRSSGLGGGLSALGSNFGTLLSQQRSQSLANEGINVNRQIAADFDTKARTLNAYAGVETTKARANQAGADAFSSFLGIFDSGFKTFGTIFDPKN